MTDIKNTLDPIKCLFTGLNIGNRIGKFSPKDRHAALRKSAKMEQRIVDLVKGLQVCGKQGDAVITARWYIKTGVRAKALDMWKGHLPELYKIVDKLTEKTELFDTPGLGKVRDCSDKEISGQKARFALEALMRVGEAKIATWQVTNKEGVSHHLIGCIHRYPKSISLESLPPVICKQAKVLYTEQGARTKVLEGVKAFSNDIGAVSLEYDLKKAFEKSKRKIVALDRDSFDPSKILLAILKDSGPSLRTCLLFQTYYHGHRLELDGLMKMEGKLSPEIFSETEKHWFADHKLIDALKGKQPVCIAVGLMHCTRTGGLVDVFKKAGLTVTRINKGEKK